MPTNFVKQLKRQLSAGGPLPAGLLAGAIGLVVSFALRGVIPGRPLGDPLPLMLALTQAMRGFTYFQWQPPLFHLLFALSLGALAFFALRFLSRDAVTREQAAQAGRPAALVNVGVVALLEVDAIIVGLWYLLSGFLSVFVTRWAAGRLAARLEADHET